MLIIRKYPAKLFFLLHDINLLDVQESVNVIVLLTKLYVAIHSIKQKLFKFLFYKDLAIKIKFFNSFSCRVFPTGEDQRSCPSATWKFPPSPSPTRKKTPKISQVSLLSLNNNFHGVAQ